VCLLFMPSMWRCDIQHDSIQFNMIKVHSKAINTHNKEVNPSHMMKGGNPPPLYTGLKLEVLDMPYPHVLGVIIYLLLKPRETLFCYLLNESHVKTRCCFVGKFTIVTNEGIVCSMGLVA
jgi:hypothetical protein